MIRVSNLRIPIDKDDKAELEKLLLTRLGIEPGDLLSFRIFKKSVDARRKRMIYFVYTVDVEVKNEERVLSRTEDNRISKTPNMDYHFVRPGKEKLSKRPVIVGTGPAGLFAGLILAQMGYCPVLLERGQDVDRRTETVNRFWATGRLDAECNVQFGEGGAGTFSDGKLTTRTRDPRNRKVLEELVAAGAPEEILYSHKPHVGTDLLKRVVKNLRKKIISLGGEVLFGSKMTDVVIKKGRIAAVIVNDSADLETEVLLLAAGHSARDTFEMLYSRGVNMVPKAFSIGVRIEHPQELIDRAQYKSFAGHKKLGAADYQLAYRSPGGRTAYTFCMCPGGTVIAAASEEGGVVTNGMSEHARDGKNGNSAILVNVVPGDFGRPHPLAGIYFQRRWERRAFELGGGGFRAPVQLLGDFLADRPTGKIKTVKPTYRPGVTPAELKECLPPYVTETIREAVLHFDKKLRGFALPEAVLTGVETRSSSPVRILRDDRYQSNIRGLYPAGEGAGYAGGIISSAVDGIRAAEAVAETYMPLK